jgi:hypothetical protein
MWIEYDIGHGTLGIGCSEKWKPSEDGPSVALEVQDFNVAIETLREHNCQLLSALWKCPLATWRPCGIRTEISSRFIGASNLPDASE